MSLNTSRLVQPSSVPSDHTAARRANLYLSSPRSRASSASERYKASAAIKTSRRRSSTSLRWVPIVRRRTAKAIALLRENDLLFAISQRARRPSQLAWSKLIDVPNQGPGEMRLDWTPVSDIMYVGLFICDTLPDMDTGS